MSKIKTKSIRPLPVFFFVSVIAIGLFHEYLAALAGAVLSCLLLFSFGNRKKIRVRLSPAFWFVAVTILFYGLSVFYAVDAGMAVIGFFKFLPLFLFALCLTEEDRDDILKFLPYGASVITLLCGIALFLPVIGDELLVAGRFAGPFQYPNAFAMFLLLAELELLSQSKAGLWEFLCHAVLLIGIFFTGSRAVFVLTVLSVSAFMLFFKGKKARIWFLIAACASVAILLVYSAVFDSFGIFKRFFSLSFTESTFVGRFLYYMDALPQILRRPLGMGYMGYYYTQSSFQTGVYSVTYVHNDFLQILLDVGWVPFGFFVFALFKSFVSPRISKEKKLILATFVLHLLFDFDLQFLPMFFLLFLYLDPFCGKEKELRLRSLAPWITAGAFCSLYLCVALAFSRFGACGAAQKMYPWYTKNEMDLMSQTEDSDKAAEIADRVLSRNDSLLLAHCAKARQAYAKGDFATLIKIKNEIFALAPFQYDEYEEYAYMLISGVGLYEQAGDEYSASVCKEELLQLESRLADVSNKMSPLGKRIKDQPTTKLPDEVLQYIQDLKKN